VENAPQADHIHFLFDPRATLTAFGAQRRRMAAAAEDLSAEELASPSRCAGWTVADVLRHLVWVDVTIRRIWSGDNALAEGFDPRRTPNEAVRIDRAISDEEIRQRYLLSTDTMVADLEAERGTCRLGLEYPRTRCLAPTRTEPGATGRGNGSLSRVLAGPDLLLLRP
jgi:uncharacterized protein (TIGR03083 family)